jgi:hypothetical protein
VALLQAGIPGVAMRVEVMVVRIVVLVRMPPQTSGVVAAALVMTPLVEPLWVGVMEVADSLSFDTPELQSRRRPWID